MAQFDLKNAILFARDGYGAAGAINNVTGYPAGTTTILVDGFTQTLNNGDPFTIAGDVSNTRYTITAHIETLGATTSITFTPAIPTGASVLDGAAVNVGPHEIQVKLGTGNCTYTEKKNRDYTLDRGKLSTVRNGDEAPLEVKFDALWEFITSTGTDEPPTVEDVFKKRGNASEWVTSAEDPCEPYAVDVAIEYSPPCGDIAREVITFPDFRYEEIAHDMKAGTLSFTGKCNVTEASPVRILPTP